ncbi:hypothetical protein BJ165DRAFT_1042350 [Panaeolus papilionaceus]|nr:hypothetical protein BJ165DRAFT_1042350 [Panaeolus papilionaceus]
MPALTFSPQDVDKSAGPLLLGILLNCVLFGVLTIQVYTYRRAFPNDRICSRILVHVVFSLEIAQTGMVIATAWRHFVDRFGDVSDLDQVYLTPISVPLVSSIVAFIVQTLYALRIRTVCQTFISPISVIMLSLVQLGGGIAMSVITFRAGAFSDIDPKLHLVTATIWNGSSALCDMIISGSMVCYLRKFTSGMILSTKKITDNLIPMFIQTGTLTVMIVIANLILSLLVLPRVTPAYYQVTSTIISKTYASTMLAVFNNRIKLAAHLDADDENVIEAALVGISEGIVSHQLPASMQVHEKAHGTSIVAIGAIQEEQRTEGGRLCDKKTQLILGARGPTRLNRTSRPGGSAPLPPIHFASIASTRSSQA